MPSWKHRKRKTGISRGLARKKVTGNLELDVCDLRIRDAEEVGNLSFAHAYLMTSFLRWIPLLGRTASNVDTTFKHSNVVLRPVSLELS